MDDFLLLANKYLNQTISDTELERLEIMVRATSENERVFKKLVQDDHLLKSEGNTIDENKIKAIFDKVPTTKTHRPVISLKKWYKYAAIFILLLGVAALMRTVVIGSWNEGATHTMVAQTVILELHDGTETTLEPGDVEKAIIDQNNTRIGLLVNGVLEYRKSTTATPLAYNTIKIPYGKNFKVRLSDQTIAHLNAGSSLRYPVAFSEKGVRSVVLEGEGFFEVAKDAARPFIVSTQDMAIEALGTSFNVLSYGEDEAIKTTLHEGSVKVSSLKEGNSVILLPNEQSIFEKNTKTLKKTTLNAEEQTGWIKGRLVFKNERFENITKTLQRTYNVVIENKNNALSDERFTAQFNTETIEEVLFNFKNTHEFKFNVNGEKIVIE